MIGWMYFLMLRIKNESCRDCLFLECSTSELSLHLQAADDESLGIGEGIAENW